MVNYYRDFWPRRSDLMAPLSRLCSKTVPWKWTAVEQKAFANLKKIISKEVLLAYPDFSKPFEIHTDASDLQLGSVISQGGRPIAFYSRKLSDAQTRYTTQERELLSIVETLKEFRNILLGQRITVYTDHGERGVDVESLKVEILFSFKLLLKQFCENRPLTNTFSTSVFISSAIVVHVAL